MKTDLLPKLRCPQCHGPLALGSGSTEAPSHELRTGELRCAEGHRYEVQDGIVMFGVGLAAPEVAAELEYENSTWHGDPRLVDPAFIAALPEGGRDLWPHTRHFGTDFDGAIELLALPPGSWVLDIGTASCWSTRKLAQRGLNAVALDINAAPFFGLRSADVQFAAHGVYFERVMESMCELPFADGTFDAVTFHASFHHTPDLQRTLDECARVLRPGAPIVLVSEEFVGLRHRFHPPDDHTNAGSHHEIEHGELRASAARSGLSVEYRLSRHHERAIRSAVRSEAAASFLGRTLERAPWLLQQLNSSTVVMRGA